MNAVVSKPAPSPANVTALSGVATLASVTAWGALLCAVLATSGAPGCTPAPSSTTPPRPTPMPSASVSVAASSTAPTPWTGSGPADASAPKSEHERALIALMSGTMATDQMPEVPTGEGQRYDPSRYMVMTARRVAPPSLRMLVTDVKGRLPPEVIQRIVRQNFGRFRLCYDNGLRNDPTLEGTVAVSFKISAKGEIRDPKSATDTTLKDTAVVDCVVKAFNNLAFPEPVSGTVQVVFRIAFAPPSG